MEELKDLIIRIDSPEAEAITEALSCKQRTKLLALLAADSMNVNEMAAAMNLSHSTVSLHIKALMKAGLVNADYLPTGKGYEKRCRAAFRNLIIQADPDLLSTRELNAEVSMPIGVFTDIKVDSQFYGITSEKGFIGIQNDPQSFLSPQRIEAQLIWNGSGWVEYMFPCQLPENARITAVEFVAEVCSEFVGHNEEYLSDITLWINNTTIGAWTSPGDFGDRRGRLNPRWWPSKWTQYGLLTTWRVDSTGSYINGEFVSEITLADLHIAAGKSVLIRIGNDPASPNQGGFNLFGSRFGDYPQDLIFRYHYTR